MDDQNQIFLEIPHHEEETKELFSKEEEPHHRFQRGRSIREDGSGESIDEQLLRKTSQLHQSLRNKKLLEFELMEAEIMKEQNYILAESLKQESIRAEEACKKLKVENHKAKKQLERLREQVEVHKKANKELQGDIELENRKIIKNKQIQAKLQKEGSFQSIAKTNANLKLHGYISVEKIKKEAENKYKCQFISEIKAVIHQVRDNTTRKQAQHQKLEEEYQNLLRQIEKEEKSKLKEQKKQIGGLTERESSTYRLKNQSSVEEEKQNNMNQMNIVIQKGQNLSNMSLKQKKLNKQPSSEVTVNKHKEVYPKALKQWVETGRKILPKKMY